MLKKADESKAIQRRARRALSEDEIQRLLRAAPTHRAFIYKFIILTGLRRNGASVLLVGDLHIDSSQPYIQLRTQQTKNGKADQLPVHPELTQGLRELTKGKLPGTKVFAAIPGMRTLRNDLSSANVTFSDSMGRRVDLHAQRHTFCTLVGKSGASLKVAQTLMRHSDPRLTANTYSHVGIFDTTGALAGVKLPVKRTSSDQLKTGTSDGSASDVVNEDCWKNVGKTTFPTGQKLSLPVTNSSWKAESPHYGEDCKRP